MKELDHIYQYLLSTDGVNQLQRSLPAQDPDSIRLDERSKSEIINFLRELSEQINFYNLNDQLQDTWSPFFDNIDQVSTHMVKAATTGNLPSVYYNGTNGVNSTLTGTSNGHLSSQDGVELASKDLLLVWQQDRSYENGIYTITQGTSSSPFLLKRPVYADQKADFNAQIIEVTGGTQHAQRLFIQQTISPVIGFSEIIYHRGETSRKDWAPHQALLLSFLHLFKIAQEDMNGLTGRHLSYYYENILQLQRKAANPDKVHAVFELNKNAAPALLPAGTLLDAGKTQDGKYKRYYALNNEIIVSQTSIHSLKSSFTETSSIGKRIVFKAEDAKMVKRGSGIGFRPFGEAQLNLSPEEKTMTEAKLGFAIASPNFSLSEGERKILVTLNLQPSPFIPPPNAFEIALTGSQGWVTPLISIKEFSSSKISIEARISSAMDPITAYNEQLHGPGFSTQFPIFRCQVLPYVYQLETLSAFTIGTVDIEVEALGVMDLILQNDQALQAPENPVVVFGSQPFIGANFYIGSREIFSKSIKSLSAKLDWQDAPVDFGQYYSVYGNTEIGNGIFSTDMYLLVAKKWNTRLLFNQSLFDSTDASLPRTLTVLPTVMASELNNSGFTRNPEMDVFTEFSNNLSSGFIKLVLTGPTRADLGNLPLSAPFEAFGHKSFTTIFTQQAIALSRFEPPDPAPLLPNEPYTPTLKSVTMDYTAGDSFNPSSPNGVEQFFCLDIFGTQEVREYGIARIVPKLPANGALYIGLQDATPPQLLSMLFQIADGSTPGNILLRSSDLVWSYLADDNWEPIAAEDILEESTNGFQQSGLIRLNIGSDATKDNFSLDKDLHWLRIVVDGNADGAGSLEAIHAQAASSTLVLDKSLESSFIDHLAKPLPSNSIGKLVNKVSGIKKVTQEYGSFQGAPPETNGAYYQRISERLRHKNRTVSSWDYERMVLDKFPQVFKVKCLPHTGANNQIKPGNIKIVVVPDFRKLVTGDPLQPRCNTSLLREISDYISKEFTSPFVEVDSTNPEYETLLVDCKVSFKSGFDPGYYSAKLNEEIKQFLSAWAYDEGMDITFGGKIYRNELLAFVEGRTYVDFIVDFKVYHRFKGPASGGISKMTVNEDFIVNTTPKPTIGVTDAKIGSDFIVGQPVEIAKATQADSILVSNSDHRIKAIQTGDFVCTGLKDIGIGQMIVKVNFIVK